MTNEGTGPTDKWIADKGAKYAYGYDKGGKLQGRLGVRGIPTAFLIDPSGIIVWKGSPSAVNASLVNKHLDGALAKPIYEWDKKSSKVKKALLGGKLKKALDEANKLSATHPEVVSTVQSMIASRVTSLERLKTEGDFLAMSEKGKLSAKALAGLPEGATVKAMMKELGADKEAQKILKAQKKVAGLIEGKIKRKMRPGVIRQLEKITGTLVGTCAARDANKAIAKIRKMK